MKALLAICLSVSIVNSYTNDRLTRILVTLGLTVALCLSMLGCGRDDHFALIGFDGEARMESVRQAMVDWCDATEGQYCPTIASHDATDNRIIWGTTKGEHELGGGTAYSTGAFSEARATVIILDTTKLRGRERWVVAHELGHHARQSRHHLGPGHLMAQYYEQESSELWQDPAFTPGDVRYALGE